MRVEGIQAEYLATWQYNTASECDIHSWPSMHQLEFLARCEFGIILPDRQPWIDPITNIWAAIGNLPTVTGSVEIECHRSASDINIRHNCYWGWHIIAPAEIDSWCEHRCIEAGDIFVEINDIAMRNTAHNLQACIGHRTEHGRRDLA